MPRGFPGGGPRNFLTESEKANRPKVTAALLKRIFSYMLPYWKQFVLVFITILASSLVGLLPSIITGRIVDDALIGRDMVLLIKLLIAAVGAVLASQFIAVLESYINISISQHIIFDMKNEMYDHLQGMPHSFFTTEKQGDIITRMNTDISGVSSVISDTLSSIFSNGTIVITSLVALFTLSWQLAIVGIVIVPLLILPTKLVGKYRWNLASQAQGKADELNQQINETLSVSGSLLVKLFTREKLEYAKFVETNKEVTRLTIREQRGGRWFRVAIQMLTQFAPLLIYFTGGWLIISAADSTLTVGTITATVALVSRLYQPVREFLNIEVDFTRSLALFTRIFDYLDRKSDIVSPPEAKKPDLSDAGISYDRVSFAYSGGVPVLNEVSFTVPCGSMYAIVGPSGAGKSTLVNLLPRLYDVSGGSVSIGSTDVREFDLQYLRQQIGVVTQDTYLFNGTIMENLLYARSDATRTEVEAACKAANIYDFIVAQPKGFETVVGNRGLKLSGGEKQRMSIARVILKDPRILILDEATSSLDSISESAIQDALSTVMHGRTSIVIAHRLSTILQADRILVLNGGKITEEGTHIQLMEHSGIYRELYETQFRKAIEYEREGK